MKLPRLEYEAPTSLAEACRLLHDQRGEAQAIAGGTDLLMALKNRQKRLRTLVDLTRIPGLDRMRDSGAQGLRIGTLVTLRRLAADPVVRQRYPLLAQAALAAGTVQLRAMGTVGGNLCQDTCCQYFNRSPMARQTLEPCHKLSGEVCHVVRGSEECWATYCGDLAPALLALQATVEIVSPHSAAIRPLQQLFSHDGKRPIVLEPGELVTELHVPAPPACSGGVYLKMAQRRTLDYPMLGVAAQLTLESGSWVVRSAALALTAVDTGPVLVEEAERLAGEELSEDRLAQVALAARKRAHPLKNLAGLAPGHRQQMVDVYVHRAIGQAFEKAKAS